MATTTSNSTVESSTILNNYIASQDAAKKTAAASSSNSSSAISQLTGNFDTFLKLLTTQLQNQDPLQPQDSSQFTQQLVSFAGVEQQINGNKKLDSMITALQGNAFSTVLGYVGKDVQLDSSSLPLQNGKGSFTYTLPSAATSVQVSIKDSSGTVVKTYSAPSGTKGDHVLTWDGKTTDGGIAKDGAYTVSVTASDNNGNKVTPTITTTGHVTGVQTGTDNALMLNLGDVQIDSSKVKGIKESSTSTTTSS
jgi:flagellar basal-body rod modification protein FlgD